MREVDCFLSDFRTACPVLCSSEFSSHDIVLHTKWYAICKGISGSAIFNKAATGTVHQNLKFKAIKLCDFKMDLIKWQLNFVSCNFGLKLYLWFQIELVLCTCSILKSRVLFQTKLHSTGFNYHYISSYIFINELICRTVFRVLTSKLKCEYNR